MPRKLIHTAGKIARPEGAGVLTTYAQLQVKATAFAQGKYILLAICGPSGIGKTTVLKHALATQEYGVLKGNASAFGAYCEAWKSRNKALLIDDADQLNTSSNGKRLLKSLCDTESWRMVTWQTSTLLGKKNAPAPPSFWTSSKVCVLSNEWYVKDGDVHSQAVGDRGMTYAFYPTGLEIHRYTATWFWDQKVFDTVAKYLPLIRNPSCRLYYRAWQEKNADGDWLSVILSQIFTEHDLEGALLVLMERHGNDTKKMVEEFVNNGHGSRATFYRYYKDLSERHNLQTIEHIKVQGKAPEEGPDPMASDDPDPEVDEQEDG